MGRWTRSGIRRADGSIYLVPMVGRDRRATREADEWVKGYRHRLKERMAAGRFPLRLPRLRGSK